MNRIAAFILVALAACAEVAPLTSQWSRPATPGTTLQADLDDCRGEASQGTERARLIDDDTTRQRDPTRDAYGGPLLGDFRRYDTERTYREAIERCMRGRGYVPTGPSR